ncbi:MAG: hypothetical protein ACQEQA_00600 [Bacillota bacterium]
MRHYFGAAVLGFFVLYLYVEGTVHAFSRHPVVFGFLILLMLLSTISIGIIFNKVERKHATYPMYGKEALTDFLSVFFGAVLTFLLAVCLDVNVVLASGLIGALAALFLKPYAVALFCGSFLGMSSPEIFEFIPFLVASVFASLIYVIAKDVFNGFGGKLGTIALSGVFISTLVHGENLLEGNYFDFEESLLIIGAAVFGALISNMLNVRFSQGAVFGSAFVGVLGGGFLPYLFPTEGLTLAIVMFGASFAGMSNRKVLGTEVLVGISGIVFGVLFVYTAHALGGLGGKLGTLALSSVLSVYGAHFIYTHFLKGDEINE